MFARKALGLDGKSVGEATLTVGLNALSKIASSISVGRHGYAWILDGAGQIIAHPNTNFLLKPVTDLPGAEPLTSAMTAGSEGQVVSRLNDSPASITYFRKISHVAGWTLCLTVPEEETQELVAQVNALLAGALVWGLVLAVILALFLARSIGSLSRPPRPDSAIWRKATPT